MSYKHVEFQRAVPVWLKDGGKEMNRTLLFKTVIDGSDETVMRMSGHFCYQVYINGELIHFGPARAGRGYYRVDEIEIGKYLSGEKNIISVLVSGYHCNSYSYVNEQAFFCAEFIRGDKVFNETGKNGWVAYLYDQKVQKVQRYTFQRTFVEVYDLKKALPLECVREAELTVYGGKSFIEREISIPELPREEIVGFVDGGDARYDKDKEILPSHILTYAGVKFSGFKREELDIISEFEAKRLTFSLGQRIPKSLPLTLGGSFATAVMKTNVTGFIHLKVRCVKDATLYLTYDEALRDGYVNLNMTQNTNVVIYKLCGGEEYELITAEPYVFKYLNATVTDGEVEITYMGVIRLDFNKSEIVKTLNDKADEQIRDIYNAAVETFRQNTLDIYMDCPSRERAGWLCDSFFTSRVEYLLTGKSTVERCFLDNFTMEDRYNELAYGLLPMCYPSDHPNGNFIPNWAMWYVLELKEYLERTADRAFIDRIREKMYSLLAYFRKFENSDGLLERLDGWVFVEWSICNKLVQDINYPSNMLYYAFKRVMSELYYDEGLEAEAVRLRAAIREKGRDGLFFADNSVYGENGAAALGTERTETCQYYAFFTGVATPEEDSELWSVMINDFGPERQASGKWPEIHPSNAFIGNYLRCDLLKAAGLDEKLDRDIRGYFHHMAKLTGTLWEHVVLGSSGNHGFASHVLVWLDHLGYLE